MSETPEQNSNPPGAAPPPPPPTQPPMQAPPAGGSQNRTIMLILSYLGIFALIPLLVEKNDGEVQWHAKHGLVLAAAEVALWLVITIVGNIIPLLGCLLGIAGIFVFLALLALHILLMVKAVNGEKMRLPVITDFAEQWK